MMAWAKAWPWKVSDNAMNEAIKGIYNTANTETATLVSRLCCTVAEP